MKTKFFTLKTIIVIFLILLGSTIAYLSSTPTPHIKEVHKELPVKKQQ